MGVLGVQMRHRRVVTSRTRRGGTGERMMMDLLKVKLKKSQISNRMKSPMTKSSLRSKLADSKSNPQAQRTLEAVSARL